MFFIWVAPFCAPFQSDWGFYSCQSILERWTHSVVKWKTHFYNLSKCSFYFQRRPNYRNGWHRQYHNTVLRATHTRIRHCCKINEMQLFGAHALQQSGVKHTIVWRQAKVSAAAESAAFSLEWDLQSPRPYLWHINIRFNIQEEEPFWQRNQTKQISKFSWIGTARWPSVPWAKQRERKKAVFCSLEMQPNATAT